LVVTIFITPEVAARGLELILVLSIEAGSVANRIPGYRGQGISAGYRGKMFHRIIKE
jgi:hypothetical protein